MEEYDSRLRHFVIHGAALRPSLHPRSAKPILHRSPELERVEGGAGDQYTGHVSFCFCLRNSTRNVN